MWKIAPVLIMSAVVISPRLATADQMADLIKQRGSQFCDDVGKEIDGLFLGTTLLMESKVPPNLLYTDAGSARSIKPATIFRLLTEEETVLFGTTPSPAQHKIYGSIEDIRSSVERFLVKPIDGYSVKPRASPPENLTAQNLFSADPTIRISCEKKQEDENPSSLDRFVASFRLTSKIEDLSRDGSEEEKSLKSVDAAKVSFRRDEESLTDVFNVDLIAGYQFSPIEGDLLSIIPYVHYQTTDTEIDGDDEDSNVESISGGVLLSDLQRMGSFGSAMWGLYPSYIYDFEQNSEALKLNAYMMPVPSTGGFMLGKPNAVGPFMVKPVITFLAEGGHVFDSGSSTAFTDNDDYFGLGGEGSIRFGLAKTQWDALEHIDVFVTYRYLELFDIDLDHAARLATGFTYTFPENKHLELKFTYEKGRNGETFQKEEFWEGAFGVKF